MNSTLSRIVASVLLAGTLLAPGMLHAETKRAITHIAGDL